MPLAALAVKVDNYVLETDAPFPTDLSLLWDAGRKGVDWMEKFRRSGCILPGWRKAKDWRRQCKNLQRTTSRIVYCGGPHKEARVKRAVREYLAAGRVLGVKVHASLIYLCHQPLDAGHWEALEYFHRMLAQHLDLVERRLLNEETIPAHEKIFSLGAAWPVYGLLGVPDRLQVIHPDCGQLFPGEARERAYRLLEENLR